MSFSSKGYVLFSDSEAAVCFDRYHQWAKGVSATEFADRDPRWHAIVRYYLQLQSLSFPQSPNLVYSYPAPTGLPVTAWVNTSWYKESEALLRGFFTGDKNYIGAVITRVRDERHAWLKLASEMCNANGAFLSEVASNLIDLASLDLQITDRGSFVTSPTSDGRHRTVAMIALGAPVIPVRLFLAPVGALDVEKQ